MTKEGEIFRPPLVLSRLGQPSCQPKQPASLALPYQALMGDYPLTRSSRLMTCPHQAACALSEVTMVVLRRGPAKGETALRRRRGRRQRLLPAV